MSEINIYYTKHSHTSQIWLRNLYRLRKHVFADRLNWKVSVNNNLEFDEYDNAHATYLIATWAGIPLASLRLINTLNPYMVEGPFRDFFSCKPPKHRLIAEASRFFVDKTRSRALGLAAIPLNDMLLLAMHNHAAEIGLHSIIAVVSKAMARIIHRAGWHYDVLNTGEASPGEVVLLLDMPVTAHNHQRLLDTIYRKCPQPNANMLQWPSRLPEGDSLDSQARELQLCLA